MTENIVTERFSKQNTVLISTLYKIKTIPSSQLKLINATKQLE